MGLKQIPNILSVIRILMVPLFVYVFFKDYPDHIYFAMGIYILAGITDIADGFLARRYNWITDLGKFLDPVADKLMQSCVLVCFALSELVSWWMVAFFIAKELFMMGGALLVLKKIRVRVKSNWYGKASTAIFYAIIFIIFIFIDHITVTLRNILFLLALLAALGSMTLYILDTLKINKEQKIPESDEE